MATTGQWLADENDKVAQQVRSSAGIAVYAGQTDDKAHWVKVAALRPPLAAALGLSGQRPDLIVRLGSSPVLPQSLRWPLAAPRECGTAQIDSVHAPRLEC